MISRKIYRQLVMIFSIINSKYSLKIKIELLLTWFRINIKYRTINKLYKLNKEKVLSYKVKAFDYESIKLLFEEIFCSNVYYFESTNDHPVIFDCGANIGFTTIYFKWLYPNSEIYAFEPDKITFEILSKNIQNNNIQGVHLYNVALSKTAGKIDFFVNLINPGSVWMSRYPNVICKDKISVDSMPLSSFMPDETIDLIKLDVEGSENEVIDDLNKNNRIKFVKKFIIEYHHKIDYKGKRDQRNELGSFLNVLESNNLEYQIDSRLMHVTPENTVQNMIIYIHNKKLS